MRWLYFAFGTVSLLNLWSAAPPAPIVAEWLPPFGAVSMVGAVAMLAICGVTLAWLAGRPGRGLEATENAPGSPEMGLSG
jgi:hypothetical protein